MKKFLVVFSGGMDSATALYKVIADNPTAEVETISFNYGSKHNEMEYQGAKKICEKLGIKNTRISLDFINQYFKSDLLKSGGEIPEGHYAADNMKSTVVPFRNGIMLSIAAGFAESIDADTLVLGNHAGDHEVYPDCRQSFIDPMAKAIEEGTWKKIKLFSPFCNITKTDLVKIGATLNVPYELTYSCYNGKEKHCHRCGTCTERIEAFHDANVTDPTIYE